MRILKKFKQLLTIGIKQDDDLIVYANNIKMVIKYNDVGLSVDYYRNGTEAPYREDQIWFND